MGDEAIKEVFNDDLEEPNLEDGKPADNTDDKPGERKSVQQADDLNTDDLPANDELFLRPHKCAAA